MIAEFGRHGAVSTREQSRNPNYIANIQGTHSVYTRFVRGGLVNRKFRGALNYFPDFQVQSRLALLSLVKAKRQHSILLCGELIPRLDVW